MRLVDVSRRPGLFAWRAADVTLHQHAALGRVAWPQVGVSVLTLSVAFGLQFADRALGQYVDESDNLLGGVLIARGERLYVDYFSQHMPLPYYFVAFWTRLGIHELQAYRVVFAIVATTVFAVVLWRFWNTLPRVLLVTPIVAWSIGQPMFSGQMVLADEFFALALLVLVLYALSPDLPDSVGDQVMVALAVWVAVQSTLIGVYPLLVLAALYVARRAQRHDWNVRRELRLAGLLLLPNLLVVLGLMATGSLGAGYDQVIRFNQEFYARYELAGDPLSILGRGIGGYLGGLPQYVAPAALRDIEGFLAPSNLAAVVLLWRKRGLTIALAYEGMVVLSQMRGNSGYHGAPYFAVSFVSLGLLLAACVAALARLRTLPVLPRVRRRGVVVPAAVASAYVTLALMFGHDIAGFYRQQPRGVGLDSPYAAVVQATTQPDDVVWAAPNEPLVYLEADRRPASMYAYYQPWLADSTSITESLLRDLTTRRPPVIVFLSDKDIPWYFPLPVPSEYAARVYALIQTNYERADPSNSVLRNVFFRKDLASRLRARLPR